MNSWRKISRQDLVTLSIEGKLPSFDEETVLSQLDTSLRKGDFLSSRNILTYFILKKKISKVRKNGLLRITRHTENNKLLIHEVVKELLYDSEELLSNLSEQEKEYLISIVNFSQLQPYVYRLHLSINHEITFFRKSYPDASFIKCLMAWLDYLFLSNYQPDYSVDSWKNFTKEELSSTVSYLIYYCSNKFPEDHHSRYKVESEYLKSDSFLKLINNISVLIDLKTKEIQLESYLYKCRVSDGVFTFQAINDNTEKSIRLGFIRTEINSINSYNSTMVVLEENSALSLYDLVTDTLGAGGIEFYSYTTTLNYPRYLFVTYEGVYQKLMELINHDDRRFSEELLYLVYLESDHVDSISSLLSEEIISGLTFKVYFKIMRVYLLFYYIFSNRMYENKVSQECLLNSLIPFVDFDGLKKLFHLVCSEEELDTFLDLMSWSPYSDEILDIQYTPIIDLEDSFYLSPSLFANSNHIRNLYASQYRKDNKKLLKDGKNDHLLNKLTDALSKKGFQVISNITINVKLEGKKVKTDIDVCVITGDTMFIFECKNGLHPVDWYSLRNSLGYIDKANEQLTTIKELVEKNIVSEILNRSWGVNMQSITKVCYSIITTSRVLNGNISSDFAVRNVNEVITFLESGIVRTKKGNYCTWDNENLTSDDLLRYLGDDNIVFKTYLDYMEGYDFRKMFFDISIVTKTFGLGESEEVSRKFEEVAEANFRKI